MQNFIKTIIDAVQTWTKKEIKQNTVQLIEDVDELKDSVENVASAAMSKKNPVGAGSFSMNRMPGSEIGSHSHAEGQNATASGDFSHAEGYSTEALSFGAHAEGNSTIASAPASHAEGFSTFASGNSSHAEGDYTNAFGQGSHAEGRTSTIGIRISGKANTTTYKLKSSYINIQQGAILEYNGGEDSVQATVVSFDGRTSAIITDKTLSDNDLNNAYVYLLRGIAFGEASHSEGFNTVAHGDYSHAEGNNTSTPGKSAHAEGFETVASGESSHAECHSTRAFGACSHAEGEVTTASGYGSHAEGSYTLASGNYSHVQGIYNINDVDLNGQALGKYAHIVGNGASDYYRSNAHTLDWSGVGWFQGGLQVGGNAQDDGAKNVLLDGDAIPVPASAQVGQTIVVSEVDENGKPTKWEAADVGGDIEVDTTLTVDGQAADAKAVGDALAGKQPAGDYALKSEIPAVPVKSVNGKTGAVSLSASDVGAMPSGTKIPSKTSDLTNDSGYITGYTESDPTVPAWAKESTKPSYTKSEVGLGNVDNVKQYSANNPPPYPITSVNGKTGAVTLDAAAVGARPSSWMPSASDVGADASGTASSAVSGHNTNSAAHSDIRLLIDGLTTRINALANSTDEDLDQMAELVAYIKNNKSLIDGITTSKVNVADIVNNLTTNVSNKPLSAAQGVALKSLVDGLQSGKLDASSLTAAINTALAQAKASGEFDGKDGQDGSSGKDGVSATHAWNGTTLTITSASGTSSADLKGAKGDTGTAGGRGTGIIKVATGPSAYTTTTGGFTPTHRIALSTVLSESGVDKVMVGDTLAYSYYQWLIGYINADYVYLGERSSLRGATGADGAKGDKGDKGDTGGTGASGTSVTVKSVSESTADGGNNVVTFSDGKTLTVKNGSKGSTGGKGDTGATGQRGTGLLAVTTGPSSYTTAVGGITPKYRMLLSTIKTQAGVTEVLLGDTIRYSYYHYPIAYLDASYAYCTTRVSIRGAAGAAGADGTSVTIAHITPNPGDGAGNVVTFSDGSTLTVRNGTAGYTPVLGTDYWTDDDKRLILNGVAASLPKIDITGIDANGIRHDWKVYGTIGGVGGDEPV